MKIILVLSALTQAYGQFLEAFNDLFDGVEIHETEFSDCSQRGFVVMEDTKLMTGDATQDFFYDLMYNGTVQALVDEYYGHRTILFVSDLDKFTKEQPNLTVETKPMDSETIARLKEAGGDTEQREPERRERAIYI